MTMKAYISGPMTGYPDFNRKAFMDAEEVLKEANYVVLNPALLVIENGTWEDYMREDIKMLMGADILFQLEGWKESKGARLEYSIASQLGIKNYDYPDWIKWKK